MTMFEGKYIQASDSRDSAEAGATEKTLCELHWSDLVARLTAARELRAELVVSNEKTLASFDAESARHLASHHDCQLHGDYQPDVNPDDLANGKGHTPECGERTDRDPSATRGNT